MLKWTFLDSSEKLEHIIIKSHSHPIIIFKHSTRCGISSIAKMRLEDQWDLSEDAEVFLLDLIKHKDLSNKIAQTFNVYHESPQILLIQQGECVHDASHFDITVDELKEVITLKE